MLCQGIAVPTSKPKAPAFDSLDANRRKTNGFFVAGYLPSTHEGS